MNDSDKIWCVIPAAGVGSRMQASSDLPKQYRLLGDRAVLAWSIGVFVQLPMVSGIAVGIKAGDRWWPEVGLGVEDGVYSFEGGKERANTVLNGLLVLVKECGANDRDWVLVHDAVRPCLLAADVEAVIGACTETDIGGVLGCEMVDTVKRVGDDGRVVATEKREELWRALTPQMFRLGELKRALEFAFAEGVMITDESAAMERMGYSPLMVKGAASNIKITREGDLHMAEIILGV